MYDKSNKPNANDFWRTYVGISTSESKGLKTIMNTGTIPYLHRIRNENVHHGKKFVVAALLCGHRQTQ